MLEIGYWPGPPKERMRGFQLIFYTFQCVHDIVDVRW